MLQKEDLKPGQYLGYLSLVDESKYLYLDRIDAVDFRQGKCFVTACQLDQMGDQKTNWWEISTILTLDRFRLLTQEEMVEYLLTI